MMRKYRRPYETIVERPVQVIGGRSQRVAVEGSPPRRTVWLVLVLAMIIAAGLRLPFLGHQSLWLDEIYTRDILGEPSLSGLWHHVQATESTPPLYYLLGEAGLESVALELAGELAGSSALSDGEQARDRSLAGSRGPAQR
jgi:hypothetical protein